MVSELFIRGFVTPCMLEQDREKPVRRALAELGYDRPAYLFSRPHLTIAVGIRPAAGGLQTLWQENRHSETMMAAIRPHAVFRSVGSSQADMVFMDAEQIREQGAEAAGLMFEVRSRENRLRLCNDGVGWVPLYFGVLDNGDFVASTSLHATIALGTRHDLDEQAAFEYLTYLHPLGHRTLLSGISCLPPGSLLQWHPREGVNIAQPSRSLYHLASMHQNAPRFTRDEMIARFREMWPSVMSQVGAQLGDDGMISLSGGLDARIISHGLVDVGLRPGCFTNGQPYLREVQIAQQVAQRLGLQHQVIELGERDYLSHVDESVLSLDGVHSPFEMYLAWHADALRPITSTIVQGTSGDVFWGNLPFCRNSLGSFSKLKGEMLNYTIKERNYIRPFISEDLRSRLDQLIDIGLDETLLPFSGMNIANAGVFWNIYHRQRRWAFAANSVMWRSGSDLLYPFFFRSFLEYTGAISPDLRENGRLHFDIHNTVLTKTRDVPYRMQLAATKYLSQGTCAYGGHGLLNRMKGRLRLLLEIQKNSVPDSMRYARETLLREINYFNERASRPWRLPEAFRAYLPVYRHMEWLRDNKIYRQRYMDLLEQARSSPPEWIDAHTLSASADAIHRGNVNFDPRLLGRIITLCLWTQLWSSMAKKAYC